MRLVTQIVGTGFDSRIWFTQALPLTEWLTAAASACCSWRAIRPAASTLTGGNTSSTSSNSSAACCVPLRKTCAICMER
ncbi:MAG: hypothetical protein BWX79_02855 [Alphaproteobacteria bacterium ADurb.Bin100]|nr:MAG: hypothetical protein BWX79_02855 [Alphaproteobacteria bacterium ADurb.Bin100]